MPRALKSRSRKSRSRRVAIKAPVLAGKGDYRKRRAYVARPVSAPSVKESARNIGHKAVDYVVDKVGAFMGNVLSGKGDYFLPSYEVKHNNLLNMGNPVPAMHSNKDGFTIRHREYLGDLISSSSAGGFAIQSYKINAGNPRCFPWLSQVAGPNFQKYRVNGMVFEFRTMSCDALNSTNTALGSVIMATNYDVLEPAFVNKVAMEQTQYSSSAKPSQSQIHPIECAPALSVLGDLYVDCGNTPTSDVSATLNGWGNGNSGGDPRFSNLGTFYIASVGNQGTSVNLGEIWVSYDITLLASIQQPPLVMQKEYWCQLDASGVTTTTLFGTSARNVLVNNMGITISGNVLTIPKSYLRSGENYVFYFFVYGASTILVTPITCTIANATALLSFSNYTNSQLAIPPPTTTATTTNAFVIANFMVPLASTGGNSDITITLSSSQLPSSLTDCEMWIMQRNSMTIF